MFKKYKLQCKTAEDFLDNIRLRKSEKEEHEIANDYLINFWYQELEKLEWKRIFTPTKLGLSRNHPEYLKMYSRLPKRKEYNRIYMNRVRKEQRLQFGCALW
ncbi:MAG: hypothetical protein AABY22_08360 [Nanoarchaeota archaeon]